MQRLRNAIQTTKTITGQYCTRSIGIKAIAIAACTIVGLNANPTITATLNSVAWLVVEVANEKDEGR